MTAPEPSPSAHPLVAEAQAFAERRRKLRALSGHVTHPGELPARPIRRVVAADRAPPSPSYTELETGVCRRCGARLAYGCDHYPAKGTSCDD